MDAPLGIVVVPAPEFVPPFQVNVDVTLSDCVPVTIPPSVRLLTDTGTSRVTVWPPTTLALSPTPGTPAPPHVAALLQFPLCVLVNDAAARGVAAKTMKGNNQYRKANRLIVRPLSRPLPDT